MRRAKCARAKGGCQPGCQRLVAESRARNAVAWNAMAYGVVVVVVAVGGEASGGWAVRGAGGGGGRGAEPGRASGLWTGAWCVVMGRNRGFWYSSAGSWGGLLVMADVSAAQCAQRAGWLLADLLLATCCCYCLLPPCCFGLLAVAASEARLLLDRAR
jgi:hypothetical protein